VISGERVASSFGDTGEKIAESSTKQDADGNVATVDSAGEATSKIEITEDRNDNNDVVFEVFELTVSDGTGEIFSTLPKLDELYL
jgi:hypothetical protein